MSFYSTPIKSFGKYQARLGTDIRQNNPPEETKKAVRSLRPGAFVLLSIAARRSPSSVSTWCTMSRYTCDQSIDQSILNVRNDHFAEICVEQTKRIVMKLKRVVRFGGSYRTEFSLYQKASSSVASGSRSRSW